MNLLLTEFGLGSVSFEDPASDQQLMYRLTEASDGALIEIYSMVLMVDAAHVIGVAAAADDAGIWQEGYVRLFLTHAALHRTFAGEISGELAIVGVDAFVAHDAMEITRPWQEQIERALNTAEVFVALVHPEFNASAWCQQESGWARGRGVPTFFVRMGADPLGFPGATQWPSCVHQGSKEVAARIISWLNAQAEWHDRISRGLFQSLHRAGNYFDAEAAAKRIGALGDLTQQELDELDRIFLANNQVGHSVLAKRALGPVYARHGRSFPDPG